MENVTKGFDNLNYKSHSDNTNLAENMNTKTQTENFCLVVEIESNIKILSETLTKNLENKMKN
jgi:hypothetical protein